MKPLFALLALMLPTLATLAEPANDGFQSHIQQTMPGYKLVREIQSVVEACEGSELQIYWPRSRAQSQERMMELEVSMSNRKYVERYLYMQGRLTGVYEISFPFRYDYQKNELDRADPRLQSATFFDLTDTARPPQKRVLEITNGRWRWSNKNVEGKEIQRVKTRFRTLHSKFGN